MIVYKIPIICCRDIYFYRSRISYHISIQSSVRVFYESEDTPSSSSENVQADSLMDKVGRPSTSGTSRRTRAKTNGDKTIRINDNTCAACKKNYENDVNGEAWIQCLVCKQWYHEKCQGLRSYRKDFICQSCTNEDSD